MLPRPTGVEVNVDFSRAPVAQWIERRPPEPDRLSVVATRVGSRAKRVEFYALGILLGSARRVRPWTAGLVLPKTPDHVSPEAAAQ